MKKKQLTFGELFRAFRKDREISIRSLAGMMNISPMYLSDVERGKRRPFSYDRIGLAQLFLHLPRENLLDLLMTQILDLQEARVSYKNHFKDSPKRLEFLALLMYLEGDVPESVSVEMLSILEKWNLSEEYP